MGVLNKGPYKRIKKGNKSSVQDVSSDTILNRDQ